MARHNVKIAQQGKLLLAREVVDVWIVWQVFIYQKLLRPKISVINVNLECTLLRMEVASVYYVPKVSNPVVWKCASNVKQVRIV
jgi:hypothetical protein